MVVYEKNMGSVSHFWSCYDFLNVENFSILHGEGNTCPIEHLKYVYGYK